MKLRPLFIYLLTLNSMNIYQPTQYFPRCLPFTAYVPFLLDNIQKIFSESLLYLRQFSESFPQHTIHLMLDWSYIWLRASQTALVVKNMPASAGDIRDMASIPWSERSPGGGHGNPLQYYCLENPTDRGDWQATVHRVSRNWTQLKPLSMHSCTKQARRLA